MHYLSMVFDLVEFFEETLCGGKRIRNSLNKFILVLISVGRLHFNLNSTLFKRLLLGRTLSHELIINSMFDGNL